MKLLLCRRDVSPDSSDNDGQTPMAYAASMGRGGVVRLISEARSSNCRSLENRDRMPTSITSEIASHQGAALPFTVTDDVPLYVADDPPPGAFISGSVPSGPPQKYPSPLEHPPSNRSYSYLSSLTLTSSLNPSLEFPFFLLTPILLVFLLFAFLECHGYGDSREFFHTVHGAWR